VIAVFMQRDAPQSVRDALRSSGAVPEGVRVRTEIPDGWTTSQGMAVTVTSDGTPRHAIAASAENIRINTYAKYQPEARELALRLDAYILDPRNPVGFFIEPGPGILCVRDADLGGWVCSTTVVASAPKKEVRLLK